MSDPAGQQSSDRWRCGKEKEGQSIPSGQLPSDTPADNMVFVAGKSIRTKCCHDVRLQFFEKPLDLLGKPFFVVFQVTVWVLQESNVPDAFEVTAAYQLLPPDGLQLLDRHGVAQMRGTAFAVGSADQAGLATTPGIHVCQAAGEKSFIVRMSGN